MKGNTASTWRTVGATWNGGGLVCPDAVSKEIIEHLRPALVFEKFRNGGKPRKPLTRMERLQLHAADWRERLSLAWAAVRGEALYRDYP